MSKHNSLKGADKKLKYAFVTEHTFLNFKLV